MSQVKHGLWVAGLVLSVLAGAEARAATPLGMPGQSESDTVRTNLWLTEALMGEIVNAAMVVLPAAPAAVRLVSLRDDSRNDLLGTVAARVLTAAGYELYVETADSNAAAAPARPVDAVFGYNVQDIRLAYPAVGRTLGVWRRWVDRDLQVSALIEISEAGSGRLLLSERIERRFGDRLESEVFALVDSDTYDFTTAATSEGGWRNRLEEVVVLGTLAGLVAIYFANTGN